MPQSEIIFVVQDSLDVGFEARALGHSIFAEGETLDEIKKKLQDAVRCHFDEKGRPGVIRLRSVNDEVIPT